MSGPADPKMFKRYTLGEKKNTIFSLYNSMKREEKKRENRSSQVKRIS